MSTWTPPVAGAVDGAGALDTGLDLKHGNRADGLIIFLGSPLRQILAVALVIHHAHPAQARIAIARVRLTAKQRDKKIRVTGDVTVLISCFRSRGNGAGRGRNKARSQPPCPCHCNHPTSRRVTHAHTPTCSTPSSDVALVRIYSTPAFSSFLPQAAASD